MGFHKRAAIVVGLFGRMLGQLPVDDLLLLRVSSPLVNTAGCAKSPQVVKPVWTFSVVCETPRNTLEASEFTSRSKALRVLPKPVKSWFRGALVHKKWTGSYVVRALNSGLGVWDATRQATAGASRIRTWSQLSNTATVSDILANIQADIRRNGLLAPRIHSLPTLPATWPIAPLPCGRPSYGLNSNAFQDRVSIFRNTT